MNLGTIGAFVPLFLFGFLLVLLGFLFVYDPKEQVKKIGRFKSDMLSAVKHSQPTWEQIIDIAEVSGVDAKTAYEVSRDILKDILVGANSEIEQYKELIQHYIAEHKEAEPFEGIPTETRIHLERLSVALNGKNYSLEPLTMQIKELVSVYEKEKKAQKRYTTWGFFIGVVGVIFAAYTYLYPINIGR